MRKIGYIFIIVLIAFFLYAPFDSEYSKKDKPELDIVFGEVDPGDIINGCRQKLEAQRDNSSGNFDQYIMKRPDWTQDAGADRFDIIYTSQVSLLTDGKVIWAAIVQANEDLFKGSNEQLPAAVVYSFDESFDSMPMKLDEISEKIYRFKVDGKDPEMISFADILADETNVHLKVKVPESLTDGLECYFSYIMIEPDFLPGGKLKKRLLPITVIQKDLDAVLLLPDDFWDSRLLKSFE